MEGLFYNKYRIQATRLSGWDYSSSGYYFITICTKNRICNFGDVLRDNNGEWSVALTDIGKIVRDCWLAIPAHFPHVTLDEWIIMPNHVHGILQIDKSKSHTFVETQNLASPSTHWSPFPRGHNETQGFASLPGRGWQSNQFGPQSRNLASVVRGFKIGVTKYTRNHNIDFHWQPRYYDRIIRDERALHAVRRYIKTNPDRWHRDRNNIEKSE